MATKIFQPTESKEKVLDLYARQAVADIRRGMEVQKVYPKEVYGGWLLENRKRKAANGKLGWFSTGQGINSFTYKVVSAENIEEIALTYDEHMFFADLGVGFKRPKEDVDRSAKARFGKRYVQMWNPPLGKTHRPSIMLNMYRLSGRMEKYIQDFYGREFKSYIYSVFEDVEDVELKEE